VSNARIAGVFYLLTFLTGGFAVIVRRLTLWLLFKGGAVPGPARSA
jgi:hypothetical protein